MEAEEVDVDEIVEVVGVGWGAARSRISMSSG